MTVIPYRVADLDVAAVFAESREMDWSEGYGEAWDSIECPSCPNCDAYCEWNEDEHGFVCPTPTCEGYGGEVDPYEDDGCEGPMMNYFYPVPTDVLDQSDAAKIADLPLCVIVLHDTEEVGLALTGGGMDLSWEICEAYMRLGFLPPADYCRLPHYAGRSGSALSERQRWVIDGCKRSLEFYRDLAAGRAERGLADLATLERREP